MLNGTKTESNVETEKFDSFLKEFAHFEFDAVKCDIDEKCDRSMFTAVLHHFF